MTQEEKAKAYDEALKKAQCWLNDPQTIQDCNYTIEDAIQNIFPVLAKNEDEMIRKELINWINGKTTYEWSYEWCENKDRWIAYLEKQKEQKSYSLIYDKDLDKAAREYYLSGGADSPIDSTGLVPIVRMAEFGATWMKERMEKEQKPAEWVELQSEFKNINEAFEDGKKEVVAHPEKYGLCECVPAEWSEEDEKKLKETLALVETIEDINKAKDGFLDVKIWLESLPERFVLQPKEEWSKKDEEIFNNIIEKAKGGYWIQMDEIAWLIARFKSLRPQPKQEWSEEDEILRVRTINRLETLNFHGISSKEIHESIDWLKSLPSNLKKKNEDVAKLCSNEWCEEDEKMLRTIISDGSRGVELDSKQISWLKSLRPQPHSEWRHYIWATNLRFDFTALIKYDNTDNYEIVQAGNRPKQEKNGVYILIKDIKPQPSWKPSDEQLRPLEYAIDYFKKKQNDTTYLESLYNDLKKL